MKAFLREKKKKKRNSDVDVVFSKDTHPFEVGVGSQRLESECVLCFSKGLVLEVFDIAVKEFV